MKWIYSVSFRLLFGVGERHITFWMFFATCRFYNEPDPLKYEPFEPEKLFFFVLNKIQLVTSQIHFLTNRKK